MVVQPQKCGSFFILPCLRYPGILYYIPWYIALSMYIIWIWSSLLLFDLVFTKKNFIKAKIPTTYVFPNRPKDQSHVGVAKSLSMWVAVFKSNRFPRCEAFPFLSSMDLLQSAKSVHKLISKTDMRNTASVCTGYTKCWILFNEKKLSVSLEYETDHLEFWW